jgi:adenylylsulfate kinase
MNSPFTVWITGLPSAGKTTIAFDLHEKIRTTGMSSVVIDGDIFRKSFCSDLGFSLNDREENIRRAASMAKMVMDSGVIAICSFVSPTTAIREYAKSIIGGVYFFEVYVSTPLEICKQRDVKELYKKANEGLIKDLTGISSPYESPENPDIQIDTSHLSRSEAISQVFEAIRHKFF